MSVIGPTALLQSMHPTFAVNSETDHASVQHSGDVTERIQILPPARSDRTATEHASRRQIMRVYSLQNASKFCHQRVATALLQSTHLTLAFSSRSKALRCRKMKVGMLICFICHLLSLISNPHSNLHNTDPTTTIDTTKNIDA